MFYINESKTIITLQPTEKDFYAEEDIPLILKLKQDGGIFDKVKGFEKVDQIRTEARLKNISGEVRFLDGHYDTKFILDHTYHLRDGVAFANEIAKKGLVKNNSSVLIFTKEKWTHLPAFVMVRYWRGELSVELDDTTLGTCWSPGVGILRY